MRLMRSALENVAEAAASARSLTGPNFSSKTVVARAVSSSLKRTQ